MANSARSQGLLSLLLECLGQGSSKCIPRKSPSLLPLLLILFSRQISHQVDQLIILYVLSGFNWLSRRRLDNKGLNQLFLIEHIALLGGVFIVFLQNRLCVNHLLLVNLVDDSAHLLIVLHPLQKGWTALLLRQPLIL